MNTICLLQTQYKKCLKVYYNIMYSIAPIYNLLPPVGNVIVLHLTFYFC